MIRKVKNIIRRVVFKFIKPEYKYINIYSNSSYSQAGEDAIINFLVYDKKMTNLSYLDIGTNNPDFGSNTYLFYTKGFRGVCVEADKSLIAKIKTIRPEDKILNLGVNVMDTSTKEADFYIFEESGLNTFDKEEALKRASYGTVKIARTEKVQLVSLVGIIEEYFDSYPDFLSIDIEGLDLMVLQSLDFSKYPIPIICAETCVYSENHIRPKDESITNYMKKQGYMVYADTYINTIFVHKDWFFTI